MLFTIVQTSINLLFTFKMNKKQPFSISDIYHFLSFNLFIQQFFNQFIYPCSNIKTSISILFFLWWNLFSFAIVCMSGSLEHLCFCSEIATAICYDLNFCSCFLQNIFSEDECHQQSWSYSGLEGAKLENVPYLFLHRFCHKNLRCNSTFEVVQHLD